MVILYIIISDHTSAFPVNRIHKKYMYIKIIIIILYKQPWFKVSSQQNSQFFFFFCNYER